MARCKLHTFQHVQGVMTAVTVTTMPELHLVKVMLCLLATLALIVVCSIYIGQLVRVSAALLIMCMCNHQRGLANVQ